jgi:hypothetical protein
VAFPVPLGDVPFPVIGQQWATGHITCKGPRKHERLLVAVNMNNGSGSQSSQVVMVGISAASIRVEEEGPWVLAQWADGRAGSQARDQSPQAQLGDPWQWQGLQWGRW